MTNPFADRFKQVDHAHSVGLKGPYRICMRLKHQSLRGQVEDDLGLDLVEYFGQASPIADIAKMVADSRFKPKEFKHRWRGRHFV